MVDFVELSNKQTNSVRTIEELLVEFVPQTFKRYFSKFSAVKANQQFVEILKVKVKSAYGPMWPIRPELIPVSVA